MQNTQSSYNIGLCHEITARNILKLRGFKLVKHNYKGVVAQVDLIMYSKTQLAFIEVKKTSLKYKDKTLRRFMFNQKKRILGELYRYHMKNQKFHNLQPILILLIFAKSKHPDLYLYYLTPKICKFAQNNT